MSWVYIVPAHVYESILIQVPVTSRSQASESFRLSVHSEITKRLGRGEGPSTLGLKSVLSADVKTMVSPRAMYISGDVDIKSVAGKEIEAQMFRSRQSGLRTWGKSSAEETDASGPDWVYPGRAADGIFVDSVRTVLGLSRFLVEEAMSI